MMVGMMAKGLIVYGCRMRFRDSLEQNTVGEVDLIYFSVRTDSRSASSSLLVVVVCQAQVLQQYRQERACKERL